MTQNHYRIFAGALAVWVAVPATGSDPAPTACGAAGAPITIAAKNCTYGLPAVHDGLVLVPKSCRLDLASKPVDRQSVEVRTMAGARIGQGSLPPQPAVGDQPADPGALLAGVPPLLVLPTGIAAIDARRGSAELVFEAQGVLLGAARAGDLLALAERLPADKSGKPKIEWTVLDLEGGAVLGQAIVAGSAVAAIALTKSAQGVRAGLSLGQDPTAVQLEALVADGAGKLAIKDGQLAVTPVAKSLPARSAPAAGCPVVATAAAVVTVRMAVLRAGGVRLPAVSGGQVWRTSENCLAIADTGAGTGRLAWIAAAGGEIRLVSMTCGQPTAPAVPATAPTAL